MDKKSPDPVLEAISARVSVALDRLDTGRAVEAATILRLLSRVLPAPTDTNIACAEEEARRGGRME